MSDFSLTELSELVAIPVRSIRFYIQKGLVNRPDGGRKNATYNDVHFEQLIQIKKWQNAGLSLDRIAELLVEAQCDDLPPMPQPKVGDINVLTQVHIAAGLVLQVDPTLVKLNSSQIRTLAVEVIKSVNKIIEEK
jgi:DNA-binding transcriptional MerR regulator